MIHAAETRPCPNVVEYARDADLLLHEAYGLEDVATQARTFGHSTAAEAGRVARDAGVRRLVLTHFAPAASRTPRGSRPRLRLFSTARWRSRAPSTPSTSEGALPVL
jgi:ribonuclease BN (tRNA processing enzyme)